MQRKMRRVKERGNQQPATRERFDICGRVMLRRHALGLLSLGCLLHLAAGFVSTSGITGVRRSSARCHMSTSDVQVQVISDFACPWCYVGKARLNSALDAFKKFNPGTKVHVSFGPYMIDPRTKTNGEDYLAYNERRWGGDGWTSSLKRSSRKDGCEFANWVTWPNSLLAHRLQKFAEDAGKGDQVNSLVFQTIYERGGNASDRETLAAVAAEAGLSLADARAYLASREGEDAVLQEDSTAKTELNVRGVPYFIVRKVGSDEGSPVGKAGGAGGGHSPNDHSAGSGSDQSKTVLNGAVAPDELLRALTFVSQG